MRMSSAKALSLFNYDQFRECIAAVLVERMAGPISNARKCGKNRSGGKKRNGKATAGKGQVQQQDEHGDEQQSMEELAEFIDYVAREVFDVLPPDIQVLDYTSWADNSRLAETWAPPLTKEATAELLLGLDPALGDSLIAYQIIDGSVTTLNDLLTPALDAYLGVVTTAPAAGRPTMKDVDACEICGRDWITLTYHHLIPREVHDKVVKRGWHRKDQLNNVAWLCRPCHNFVHQFASNEDLARNYYTTELLLEQDEIMAFAKWAGRLRWKGGGTLAKK
jgi:hypothetical protein